MIQRLTDIKNDASAAFEKESKQLLVRIDSSFITLALADKNSGEWDATEILSVEPGDWKEEDFADQLKQKSNLIALSSLETKLFFESIAAIPVPQAIVQHAETYLEMQFGRQPNAEIITQESTDDISVALQISPLQAKITGLLFPHAERGSTLCLLIKQALYKSNKSDWPVLLVNMGHAVIEMVMAQHGNLLIAKAFGSETAEDMLYHLLNCCRQFHAKPAETNVQVQGIVKEEDERIHLLQNYFTHVSLVKASRSTRNPIFRQVPDHYFTGLTEAR